MSLTPWEDMHRRRSHVSEFGTGDDVHHDSIELGVACNGHATHKHVSSSSNDLSSGLGPSRHSASVDFQNVAVYIPALQACIAVFCSCVTCILSTLLGTAIGVSAIRTATLGGAVGTAIMWKLVDILHARGSDLMFDALRPQVFVYIIALISEQLIHSCGHPHTGAFSPRHWLFYGCTMTMTLAGFAQALRPKAQTDYPWLLSCGSLVVVALFAPPPRMGDGPLCDPPSTSTALERSMRSLLFSISYSSLAYASEPPRHSVREVLLCAMRAVAGSMWTLAVHRYVMWLALVQALLVLWSRLGAGAYQSPEFYGYNGAAECANKPDQSSEMQPLYEDKNSDMDTIGEHEDDDALYPSYNSRAMSSHPGKQSATPHNTGVSSGQYHVTLGFNGGDHVQRGMNGVGAHTNGYGTTMDSNTMAKIAAQLVSQEM